jgi:hypothetical protein
MIRGQVIKQYRDFLRTAKKLPDENMKKDVVVWVRSDFKANASVPNSQEDQIKSLLKHGEKMLKELKQNVDVVEGSLEVVKVVVVAVVVVVVVVVVVLVVVGGVGGSVTFSVVASVAVLLEVTGAGAVEVEGGGAEVVVVVVDDGFFISVIISSDRGTSTIKSSVTAFDPLVWI